MKQPLFSVVIPAYRRSDFLTEAVESVLAQTVTDLECLVVDDASPEPIADWSDRRVRVIRRAVNGGPAAARNTGLDQARGTYIAFLDSDDLYTPRRLELAVAGLERAPVAVCWSRYLHERSTSNRILDGDVRDTIMDATIPHLGATAVRRDRASAFDETFVAGQDVEWWLRLAQTAEVATIPEVGCLIRRHSRPRHRNDVVARIEASLRLLQLHDGYFVAHRRGAAFRWKRIGLMARSLGDKRLARSALIRSLRLRPEAAAAWHLLRALGRTTETVPLTPRVLHNGAP